MSVELNPSELGFRRPFIHEVTQLLRLRNPSEDPIAFKVKTTAPKQYVFVAIMRGGNTKQLAGIAFAPIQDELRLAAQWKFRAMREDPPPDARCRDKFLVQSVAITPDRDMSNITATWQNVEKNFKDAIQERKIRVIFLPADSSIATPVHNNLNGSHLPDEAPPAYGSPAPSFGSPTPDAVTPAYRAPESSGGRASSVPRSSEKDVGGGKQSSSGITSNIQCTLGGTATNISNVIPTSADDLQAQLSEAKATISHLKQQAEDQMLRQKKTDAVNQDSRERITTGTTGMGIQQQPADGVPVQIVAALCLLSFLLAYFFF